MAPRRIEPFPSDVSHLELAKLCAAAYNAGVQTTGPQTTGDQTPKIKKTTQQATELCPGWELLEQYSENDTAFKVGASLFRNKAKQTLCLAFRGTDNIANMYVNLGVTFGFLPHAVSSDAEAVLRKASARCKKGGCETGETAPPSNLRSARLVQLFTSLERETKAVPCASATPFNSGNLDSLLKEEAGLLASITPAGLLTSAAKPAGLLSSATAPSLFPGCHLARGGKAESFLSMDDRLVENLRPLYSSEDIPQQLAALVQSIEGHYRLVLAGHSLGGLLALVCGVKSGFPVFAVESPGCSDILGKLEGKDVHSRGNIVEYLAAPNLVNTRWSHIGDVRHYKVPHAKTKHSAGYVATCLGTSLLRIGGVAGAIFAPHFGGAAAAAFLLPGAKGAVGHLVDTKALMLQHSVDRFVEALASEHQAKADGITGRSGKVFRVVGWPTFFQFHVQTPARAGLKNLVPLHPEAHGIRNMWDEQALLERKSVNTVGFKVEPMNIQAL